jgi:hypothetical protein
MSLNGNKSRLTALTKNISLRWAETKDHWRDAKSAEFEQRFMQELFPHVNKAAAAVEKLEELLNKIRKDCE